MKKGFVYSLSIGDVGIAEENGVLTNIFFGRTVRPKEYTCERTELLDRAAEQIERYLAGELSEFILPFECRGTEFEKRVWAELVKIPYGATKSYADIAAALGKPKAVRAVGRANGLNPISIIVPCHRVIGKNGSLTGYAGGTELKLKLLCMENPAFVSKGTAQKRLAEIK